MLLFKLKINFGVTGTLNINKYKYQHLQGLLLLNRKTGSSFMHVKCACTDI